MKVGLWPQFISSGFDNPSYIEEENVQVMGRKKTARTGKKFYPGIPGPQLPGVYHHDIPVQVHPDTDRDQKHQGIVQPDV